MSIRSNTIVKCVIIVCKVVSGLLDVGRAVEKKQSDIKVVKSTASQKVAGIFILHKVVSQANNAGSHDCESTKHLAPFGVVQGGLANAQGNQVVDEASTKNPVTAGSETSKTSASDGFDGCGRESVLVVCNTEVVDEVENANASKGLGVDVCENR